MILYIAEKPSLGRAIAGALPKPLQKGDGFIRAANGDVVSWCIGHLLEQAEPEDYDPVFKKWAHAQLPIIPQKWQLKAKKQTAKQLSVLKKWVKQADQLVHAGDPDREGQLLVDEVIDFLGVKGKKRDAIKRCLISDLNPPAVKQSLSKLRDNREFIPLSVSALARSRADWLYGINLTRAYTLQGQKVGYQGVLSVGRVQTPLLGLVVNRDRDIANFVSKPFYNVWAHLRTENNENFKAKWVPSEHCAAYLDEHGRNVSRPLAENVVQRASFQPATVKDISRKKKSRAAPLPYNLSSLQIDANKAYGFSAKQALDICQALYEQHNAITYPRSDSRYLPMGHFSQAPQVLACVQNNLHQVDTGGPLSIRENDSALFASLKPKQKSKAWNDSKVDAHHAIIPTQKSLSRLSSQEAKIYRLICRNYVAQFLPNYVFFDSQLDIEIAAGKFVAKAKEIEQEGWKSLFMGKGGAAGKASVNGGLPDEKSNEKNDEDSDPNQTLPSLSKGQQLESLQAEVEEKNTSPPKHFTEATLLAAMTGIGAFVKDPALKKVLKETDGLGTEATRAGIIELLFKRGFMVRMGKTVKATETGKGLIEALPESTTLPDRTARWESILTAICEREAKYETLMTPLQEELAVLVQESQSVLPTGLKGLGNNKAKKFTRKKRGNGASKSTGEKSYGKSVGKSGSKVGGSRKATGSKQSGSKTTSGKRTTKKKSASLS